MAAGMTDAEVKAFIKQNQMEEMARVLQTLAATSKAAHDLAISVISNIKA